MGLDNGIVLYSKRALTNLPKWLVDWEYTTDEEDTSPTGEIVHYYHCLYWRKWWGFRNEVIAELSPATEEYEYQLNAKSLTIIKDIYERYNDEEVWNTEADSIWDWDEVKDQFADNIQRFNWLIEYAKICPNAKICFYDSY